MRRPSALLLAVAVAVAGAACSGAVPSSTITVIRAAQASAAPTEPVGKVVLRVAVEGSEDRLLDMAFLESLETSETHIHDPFVDEDHTYQGVQVATLLAALAVEGTHVRFIALDDYVVDLSSTELADGLLATREDGLPIDIPSGGPLRLVFVGDSSTARNTDMWIWSIHRMVVS